MPARRRKTTTTKVQQAGGKNNKRQPATRTSIITSNDDGSSSDKQQQQHHVVSRYKFLVIVLVAVHFMGLSCLAYLRKRASGISSFMAGDGVEVHVVRDFLPTELAAKWRRILVEEWQATERYLQVNGDDEASSSSTNENKNSSAWQYATNNNGQAYLLNQKIRSLQDVEKRRALAQVSHAENKFAYAKWELQIDHPLLREIEEAFNSEQVVERVKHVVEDHNLRPGLLSDLFVTHFTTGDFLGTHDDGLVGKWAIVLSLLDGGGGDANIQVSSWNADTFGGALRFQCPYNSPPSKLLWCETVSPSFNTALIFRIQPRGPYHEVTQVQEAAAAFRRFAVTGWYGNPNRGMTQAEKNMLQVSRGRD